MTESGPELLFDEHGSRVFERVLTERGFSILHATDQFGEHTVDRDLLTWCGANGVLLCTNDARDFERLHEEVDHAGLLCYRDQDLPDDDPTGLASAIAEVVSQYGTEGLENEFVELDDWYRWL